MYFCVLNIFVTFISDVVWKFSCLVTKILGRRFRTTAGVLFRLESFQRQLDIERSST